jgi:hypothetical protein
MYVMPIMLVPYAVMYWWMDFWFKSLPKKPTRQTRDPLEQRGGGSTAALPLIKPGPDPLAGQGGSSRAELITRSSVLHSLVVSDPLRRLGFRHRLADSGVISVERSQHIRRRWPFAGC